MRSEVGEWLATCVGSPICILLLSWSLLIYQNQPSSLKRKIDVLTVAVITQSLVHQLGLLFYAILTLIRPTANHFGEICTSLVWLLNSSSILQQLTLASIAIFAAINNKKAVINLTKNHVKYHLVSLSVVSACIGFTGILNYEPEICVFLAQEISVKYGIFINALKLLLLFTTIIGVIIAICKDIFCSHNNRKSDELLQQSVSDLSDTSSKNSSGVFTDYLQHHAHNYNHWADPLSSGSTCTNDSSNSRAYLNKKRKKSQIDETGSRSTVYSILFVCYFFDHLPVLVVSIQPELLRGFCTPQNVAIWLPLVKDTLLPVFLAFFDKMFCRYVAKVYTKQDSLRKLAHCGIDGKFRHFEQDAEYKLQLNLNHGLKFPLTNGSLYGRIHYQNHQNRSLRTGTITMGVHQHYSKSQSLTEDNNYGSLPPAELTSFTSSTFEPRLKKKIKINISSSSINNTNSTNNNNNNNNNEQFDFGTRRKIAGSTDVFGQNMKNLVQLQEEPQAKKFGKNLDGIAEGIEVNNKYDEGDKFKNSPSQIIKKEQELMRNLVRRNHQNFENTKYLRSTSCDTKTYNVNKGLIKKHHKHIDLIKRVEFDQEAGYETSDDESCDSNDEAGSYDDDTISSCKSKSQSCCSVTTVANDDFEFFQRKAETNNKADIYLPRKSSDIIKVNMRSFTPRIMIDNNRIISCTSTNNNVNNNNSNNSEFKESQYVQSSNINSKLIIQSCQLKKITPGYSMNDLDKIYPDKKRNHLSTFMTSLKDNNDSFDKADIYCNKQQKRIGGSVPDLKKIFISE